MVILLVLKTNLSVNNCYQNIRKLTGKDSKVSGMLLVRPRKSLFRMFFFIRVYKVALKKSFSALDPLLRTLDIHYVGRWLAGSVRRNPSSQSKISPCCSNDRCISVKMAILHKLSFRFCSINSCKYRNLLLQRVDSDISLSLQPEWQKNFAVSKTSFSTTTIRRFGLPPSVAKGLWSTCWNSAELRGGQPGNR